ncbi:MAG: 50S ribosomal protein L3 [Patescibacteria group bacterium]|nr:50S ribosomal protein L3 [Patescibacteria group bacterium]
MKYILAKKLEMTQIWQGDNVVPVTRVQAGPCVITQIKTLDKDGYDAVQIGFGEKKEKNIKKPQLKKLEIGNWKLKIQPRYYREFRITPMDYANGLRQGTPKDMQKNLNTNLKVGDVIDVSAFEAGDAIKVTGISKGKGFQGVVKRHGFHGQDQTHGNKDQLRMPGSIGATGPAHVFKGQKMPGRMGGDRVTVSNLKIIEVDKENNILLIKGAVPGARNGLLRITHNS